MCEFCTQHGEGKEWYLAMKNYGEELLAQDKRREYIVEFVQNFEQSAAHSLGMLDAVQALPFVPDMGARYGTATLKANHFGQVVPIEDVDKVLGLVDNIVRLPCPCRKLTTGRTEGRFCFGLGIDPTHLLGQFPDYARGLEWLTREQASEQMHKLDTEGLVHSVWTFKTPFIGAICNCDQDCVAYRLQYGMGVTQIFFPAEYVASVDPGLCAGCKTCRGTCPFGAIRYSAARRKCEVDPALCYGCGICRATCKNNAIGLEQRRRAFRWHRRRVAHGRYRPQAETCSDALACRACLDACPAKVLGVAPRQPRLPGIEPGEWTVRALTPSLCTGCGDCVRVCPEEAITIRGLPKIV